jgi:virulence-associated protein VapD
MAQYAIAFDLNTKAMSAAGFTKSDMTSVYQTEIPNALRSCGFTAHPQGSLYHTEAEQNPITAIMALQGSLRNLAPRFCAYVKSVHVFRMDEWSDVTEMIAERPATVGPPEPEEELEAQILNE